MTKKKLRVLVDSGFDKEYETFLSRLFDIEVVKFVKDSNGIPPTNIDLMLFTGGADVGPGYYNEDKGSKTNVNEKRDDNDYHMYNSYYDIPKLGICRGAQFLTVMSGGKLIQHVEGHLGNHKIHVDADLLSIYVDSRDNLLSLEITSTHHQMMFPYNLKKNKYNVLGWSKRFISNTYLNGKDEEIDLPTDFLEPEIVYYKNTNSLCIQGHPEMSKCPESTKNTLINIINSVLFKKVIS